MGYSKKMIRCLYCAGDWNEHSSDLKAMCNRRLNVIKKQAKIINKINKAHNFTLSNAEMAKLTGSPKWYKKNSYLEDRPRHELTNKTNYDT